jgi:hypothetical protein
LALSANLKALDEFNKENQLAEASLMLLKSKESVIDKSILEQPAGSLYNLP